ncbi:hypothetical protein KBC54_01430 [Patescibacteria group bacterium]|nr:hypothetical protein [Patescibacteria group bacterium]
MFLATDWNDEGRPGYFGPKRDEILRGWDRQYGPGRWTLAWKIPVSSFFTDYLGACAIYEDAYFMYLMTHLNVLNELVCRASNVYDVDPSDVQSGLDYRAQQHDRTHVQDIAIRRALTRLGMWFFGRELIQIRYHKQIKGKSQVDPLSIALNPGSIPFHQPELLEKPFTLIHDKWYDPKSVEAFYQFNKHLLVRV